jgi:hypothetical protein
MQLTLANVTAYVTSIFVGWLMVQAGAAKKALTIKRRKRCAACGRRLERGRCPCVGS